VTLIKRYWQFGTERGKTGRIALHDATAVLNTEMQIIWEERNLNLATLEL
jgi:hypothetical protein